MKHLHGTAPNMCCVHAFLQQESSVRGLCTHNYVTQNQKHMSKELAQYNDSLKQAEAISFAHAKE